MKLELKHLAGYLPYGLKMYWEDNQNRPMECWELKCELVDFVLNNQNKPILRPLSDLAKEIEVNGEKFVPIISLAFTQSLSRYQFIEGAFYCNNYGKFLDIKEMPYTIIEKLYEWHFDIYGLIENNLAIDKNTIL